MSRFPFALRRNATRTARDRCFAGPQTQGAVNDALSAFVVAAQEHHGVRMESSLAIVQCATEQQVQRAMLHVQRAREISRRELLALLAG